MKESRLSPLVDEWLNAQIDKGNGWPAIQKYLELPEDQLSQVCEVEQTSDRLVADTKV